jgi:hypothetical protein
MVYELPAHNHTWHSAPFGGSAHPNVSVQFSGLDALTPYVAERAVRQCSEALYYKGVYC